MSPIQTRAQAVELQPQAFQYRILTPKQDHHQLMPIWQLVAGNLLANGDVAADQAMMAAQDSVFDQSEQTRIIRISHRSGRVAGTYSLTMDGDDGMPVLHHFESELTFLRRKYRLANGWRFSMSPLFTSARLRRGAVNLFLQLVQESDADAFVLYFNKRLANYYQRMFHGRMLACRDISLDGRQQLPVQLMLCEVAHNRPDTEVLPQPEVI